MQRRTFTGLGLTAGLVAGTGLAAMASMPAGLVDGKLTVTGRAVFSSVARAGPVGSLVFEPVALISG